MSEKTAKKKKARKSSPKAAKPKDVESSAEEAASSPAASSEPPAASKADPYDGKIYTIGTWKGLPNYECMFCGYATVNLQTALEHAAEQHAPPEKEIVDTGIVDESGDPITRARQPKED